MATKIDKIEYPIITQKQKFDVEFIRDDDIDVIISSKKEFDRQRKLKGGLLGKRKGAKRKLLTEDDFDNEELDNKKIRLGNNDDIELALAALEGEEVTSEVTSKPTSLFDNTEDISARDIYNYLSQDDVEEENGLSNVNSKQDSDESSPSSSKTVPETPKTNLSKIKTCLKTPSSSSKKCHVSFKTVTPDASKKELPNGNTPYSQRKRYVKDIKKIQKILEGDQESGSESDIDDELSESGTDDKNNSCTSKLTQDNVEEILKSVEINKTHEKSIRRLIDDCSKLFDKWTFALQQNFNILLYGVGSKAEILSEFSKKFINKHPVIVANGYFPNLSVKDLIDKICLLFKIDTIQNVHEMVDLITKKVENKKLILIVNNIDGNTLRNNKTQLVLSRLARVENIYLIASIDHINAPLIWDQGMLSDFNWMWFNCTNYLNYNQETIYENNVLLKSSKALTLSSLRNVFNSLTKNSKQIFMIILNYQLENQNKNYSGLSFKDLYRESRKELLITSDVGLRSQLKEFLDHAILKLKKNLDGEECYIITIDNQILKLFLDEQG